MRHGRFVFNEERYQGYKLWLVVPNPFNADGPVLLSIAHNDRGTILPYSEEASCWTVCLFGGINGKGHIWRFENYGRKKR